MKIQPIENLPKDFEKLMIQASQEGHLFLSKMKDEWSTGINRFCLDGEILYAVTSEIGETIAVGGLNIDPYIDDPTVGRIRHVYVAPGHQRKGIGKNIVKKNYQPCKLDIQIIKIKNAQQASRAILSVSRLLRS